MVCVLGGGGGGEGIEEKFSTHHVILLFFSCFWNDRTPPSRLVAMTKSVYFIYI